MKSDFLIAVTQLAAERHLPRDAVISAIEAALAAAYKRDSVNTGQEISVSLNPANGELKIFTNKVAVKKVEDPQREIRLTDAKKLNKDTSIGDIIPIENDLLTTGRIAAQTAKQVVLQRLREAERDLVFEEYTDKEGDIVTGTIQRVEQRQVILDLGRTEAIMPSSEQVLTERYRVGQKIKVHISEVRRGVRGPEIIVSRHSRILLRRLFEMEVPEITNGVVEIKGVAREAGSRSKVAVHSRQDGVDPVGSCVGLRGIRIQNIVNELQGEKIDVVLWHPSLETFLTNALSPCPVTRVNLDVENDSAVIVVPDRQLSLAIGREGQNARLCAKLSGLMTVNIKSASEVEQERKVEPEQLKVIEDQDLDSDATVSVVAPNVTTAEETLDSLRIDESTLESGDALSIEEQLAADAVESLITETETREELVGDAATPTVPETVWSIAPSKVQQQGIRFAEDIVGPRTDKPSTSRKRTRKTKTADESPSRGPKRSRQVIDTDEDDLGIAEG